MEHTRTRMGFTRCCVIVVVVVFSHELHDSKYTSKITQIKSFLISSTNSLSYLHSLFPSPVPSFSSPPSFSSLLLFQDMEALKEEEESLGPIDCSEWNYQPRTDKFKIYFAATFHGELAPLRIALYEVFPLVEGIVLVDSNMTFSGLKSTSVRLKELGNNN